MGDSFHDCNAPPIAECEPSQASGYARFALLLHDHPHPHWDWLLQKNSVLITFRSNPDVGPDIEFTAIALPNHRLHYLTHTGQVSGDRGTVRRVDEGPLTWLTKTDQEYGARIVGHYFFGDLWFRKSASGIWIGIIHRNPI